MKRWPWVRAGCAGPLTSVALSSNPEESRREVTLEGDETLQSYTVMNGFTDWTHASNTDVRLQLEGTWRSPTVFYDTVIPAWRVTVPDTETQSRPQAEVPYMEPLGFLGIVVKSLRVAAMDVEGASSPRKFRYAFAHKGELTYLVLSGHGVDGGRHQRYVADGLVEPDATVHRLDYRILDREGGLVQRFRLWDGAAPGAGQRGFGSRLPARVRVQGEVFSQAAHGPRDRHGVRIVLDQHPLSARDPCPINRPAYNGRETAHAAERGGGSSGSWRSSSLECPGCF